jgi:DNA-binding NtrC family response regulator
VHNRAFRADLLNELSVLTLNLPPLRERKDDIIPLTEKWLAARAAVLGKTAKELSPAARDKLLDHDWPGNFRELQTVIERALIVEELPVIAAPSVIFADRPRVNDHMNAVADAFARFRSEQGRPLTLAQLECAYLVWLLELTGGNRTAASRLLGVSYPTIMKKIVDYRIDFNAIAARGRLTP